MDQTWNLRQTKEMAVRLSDHIVLTPYAAKRLLTAPMRDHQGRIGPPTIQA
jgi:hypothetical protein